MPSSSNLRLSFALGLGLAVAGAARAQDVPAATSAAPAPAAAAASSPAGNAPAAPPASGGDGWEGALGLILVHEPSFSGAGDMSTKPELAFYLRKGRFAITNASVFVTRRQDDVLRGASADLIRSDTLRVNLALRIDNGRRENASDRLSGMGDVQRTVRGRLSLTWTPAPGWRLGTGLSPDLLNRGGGLAADLGLAHDFRLGPRSVVTAGASLNWFDRRRMQSYYGLTAEQALATGLTEYRPGAGLTGWTTSLGWRGDIHPRWSAFVSGSRSRLLGPTLDSPLVTRPSGWSVSSGVAWRF